MNNVTEGDDSGVKSMRFTSNGGAWLRKNLAIVVATVTVLVGWGATQATIVSKFDGLSRRLDDSIGALNQRFDDLSSRTPNGEAIDARMDSVQLLLEQEQRHAMEMVNLRLTEMESRQVEFYGILAEVRPSIAKVSAQYDEAFSRVGRLEVYQGSLLRFKDEAEQSREKGPMEKQPREREPERR